MPVIRRMTTAQAVAERKRRSARELARIPLTCIRWREQISQAAYSLDDFDPQLFADATDEHLDRVGVAIEILVVEMLDQLGTRHHAAGVMHQIGKQPVFVAGEFNRVTIDRYAARAGVEAHGPTIEFALGVAGGSAQERPYTSEHFLQVKRLGDVIVGTSIETLHFVAPAITSRQHEHRHRAPGPAP